MCVVLWGHEATERQKAITIHNLCMSDNVYLMCCNSERLAVESAYRRLMENVLSEVKTEDGEVPDGVRDVEPRDVQNQKSVSGI